MTQERPARRRVDAQRNRDKILAAARAAFADPQADVSMAEIARRANIGSATLYRNFADRRILLEALYGEEIAAICRAAETSEGATAGARLQAWLYRFYDYFLHKRVLASELLELAGDASPADITAEQILAFIASIANIPGEPEFRKPILIAALDALWAR
ncbi:TetR/AcrR family transcriptional regulator [Aduncisulcus paluster]|uniref:TetR/AcrR family transcriptional regulator n=1 Tax=Aduncisulcus paluster TaxID=2918883 RepID=A0ABQ5KXR8_9EUKA|nr:TetR/AcrR family transcriptional regulator [Aduncisulcus paluster]